MIFFPIKQKFFYAFFALLVPIVFLRPCPAAFPRLALDRAHVRAGSVVEGFNIRHTFVLKNQGLAPLEILEAKTDCSCTDMAYDKVIQPDSNCYFRVVFHTLGQVGDQVKTIRLSTNDPKNPEVVLEIHARVLPAVEITPNRIFLNGEAGAPMKQSLIVKAQQAFELTLVEDHLPKGMTMGISPTPDHHAYLLDFAATPITAGSARGRVFFKTTIPHKPRIMIPAMVRAR